jgi:hypothetical protein
MKFIYYSDFHLPVEQVVSGADATEFFVVDDVKTVDAYVFQSQTLVMVLDKPISQELINWRKSSNLQTLKVVLISNKLTEESLRTLQMDHGFYDLFFKYPVPVIELEDKVKLISTFTQNIWTAESENTEKVAEPTLQMGELEIANLVDEVSLTTPTLETAQNEEHPADHENDLGLSLVDGLTGEANLENPEKGSEQKIDESLDLLTEEKSQDTNFADALSLDSGSIDVEGKGDLSSDLLSSDIDTGVGKEDIQIQETDLQNNDSDFNLQDEPESAGHISNEVDVKKVEKVSLNELLENKDDQIYRLMSKNKMLEEEVIEKEEFVKQLQKELRELQTTFDKNKNFVEESTFQMNVLKSTHEQEKLEIKKNLDVALAKIKLLEARIEELKNNSSQQTKATEATLSIGELRKLKARQEHLEEKISLLQSDSAIQLQHREKKIIDLKRKVDLLEFDVKDSLEREAELKRKLQLAESKMAQTKQLLKQVMEDSTAAADVDLVKKTGSYDV